MCLAELRKAELRRELCKDSYAIAALCSKGYVETRFAAKPNVEMCCAKRELAFWRSKARKKTILAKLDLCNQATNSLSILGAQKLVFNGFNQPHVKGTQDVSTRGRLEQSVACKRGSFTCLGNVGDPLLFTARGLSKIFQKVQSTIFGVPNLPPARLGDFHGCAGHQGTGCHFETFNAHRVYALVAVEPSAKSL